MSQISKLEATTQLTSPNFPLMPDETQEEFEAYRSCIIGALKPRNALSENIAEDIVSAHWEIHWLERWRSIVIRDRAKKYDEEHAGEDLSQGEIMAFAYRRALVTVQYYKERIEVLHRWARRLFQDYRMWQPVEAKQAEDVVEHEEE